MKTPRFWQKNGIFPTLLTPLGWVYGAATQLRLRLGKPRKCKAKVICIGNITAGGVGKTPVAMAMAEQYIKAGKKVFFVTRGYKGKLKNIVVNLERLLKLIFGIVIYHSLMSLCVSCLTLLVIHLVSVVKDMTSQSSQITSFS